MKKLHLVCNAHLDPVWLWQWEEGLGEALSTFRIAADFCENYNGFVFNHNEALLYEWVEEFEPELFKRIQELVKQGKWHIMGGWYVQPDCTMPAGESFTRQVLYGKNYFMDKFGVEPKTAINFDPFGHTRGLVQIMAKSGYDSYIFCRPDVSLKELPGEDFTWVGYDGSEVTGHRSYRFYLSSRGKAVGKIEEFIEKYPDRNPGMVLWGIGNHGGGPSKADLEAIQKFREDSNEYEIVHSTPEDYFTELRDTGEVLGKFDQSINPFAVGCYTSQIRIKQKHRKLENELYSAEKMMSMAKAAGLMDYDNDKSTEALKDLMFCEFHDILPGSSIQAAEEDAIRMMDHGLEITSRLKATAFFHMLTGEEKALDKTLPIFIFNPHPWSVSDIFTCEYMNEFNDTKTKFSVPHVVSDGVAIPCQDEREASSLSVYDWRKRVVFKGELKPFSMNRFDLTLEALDEKPKLASYDEGSFIRLSTDRIDISISKSTGLIEKYLVDGKVCIVNGANPLVIKDNADAWGMLVDRFENREGEFKLMAGKEAAEFANISTGYIDPVLVTEDGSVRTIVDVYMKYNSSKICMSYIIPKVGAHLDIKVRVYWAETDKMLKLELPTDINDKYIGQTAFGWDDLPTDGGEAVAHKWVAAVSDIKAIAVINDCQYGSSFKDGNILLTLLRSPVYSGHPIGDNPIVIEDRYTPRIDQGERLYSFRILAGGKDSVLESIDRKALEFNEVPMVITAYPSGEGKKMESLLEISCESVTLHAFKKAEDGDGFIMRLFNGALDKKQFNVCSKLLGFDVELELGCMEVATYRVKNDNLIKTDLLERKI